MKIFGLMVAKNEVDIIAHTLLAAAQWCDAIYVLDNGSEDGTWELVRRLARENRVIVAHEQSFAPFTEAIRARLFNAYRERAKEGDWWCRLDADEVYVECPRDFLAEATSHEVVWAIHLQYYFTEIDMRRFKENPDLYDPALALTHRYHYYRADASEPRFFRHRDRLRWDAGAWPRHLGRVFPKRILLRHNQVRSPAQIKMRLATRSAIFERGGSAGRHWRNTDLREKLPAIDDLHYDAGNGIFKIDEKILPRHMDPFWKATVKSLMHSTGLWP
jgi:glycosyltransferase involved in cell wall biosynthesis